MMMDLVYVDEKIVIVIDKSFFKNFFVFNWIIIGQKIGLFDLLLFFVK